MQNKPGVKQIAADSVSRLPWLAPPAGYLVLIQDVAYGNRYKIARHQQLDRRQIERGADFPFETRVALILEAENAAEVERDLHDELAAGSVIGDWFDLDQFPKSPPAQSTAPLSTHAQGSVSLRELVENDDGADSLLQAANIVGARSKPAISAARRRSVRRRARRRRPRVARWALAFGLIAVIGVLVAEYSSDIGRVLESILDDRPQQSTSPTPALVGWGDVFYTIRRAHLRSCADLSCSSVDVFPPGTKVRASKAVKGQRLHGSIRWIEIHHMGEKRYLHYGALSRIAPQGKPTPEPSSTPAIEGRGEVYYTKTRARVRTCANVSCKTVEVLSSGSKITARRYVSGQQVNGSARWIAFLHRDELSYIHDSVLSPTWPLIDPTPEPSPTVEPTRVKATAVGQGEVFYVRSRAVARHCARRSCEILEVLPPGTKITALRFISGDVIGASERWIRFSYKGRHLSIHSGKLSRIAPTPVTSPTAQPAGAKAAAAGAGARYYLKIRARARTCPRQTCEVAATLPMGSQIMARGYVSGQTVNGNDRWVSFDYSRRRLYVRQSLLSSQHPLDARDTQPAASAQAEPRDQSRMAAAAPLWVKERATVYKCVNTRCQAIDVLERGAKVNPLSYWYGQRINDSTKWIRLRHKDQTVYLHSSYASADEPELEPTAEPSPTRKPLQDEYKATSAGQIYTVKSGEAATVRNCANSNCVEVGTLMPGAQIQAKHVTKGQALHGSNDWIMFHFEGWNRFVHSGDLVPAQRMLEATLAPSPTLNPTAIQAVNYVKGRNYYVRSRVRASVHICASPICDEVGVLLPGMQVWAVAVVHGRTVEGSNLWIQFGYRGERRYVHTRFLLPMHDQVDTNVETSPPVQSSATETPPPTSPPATATSTATDPPAPPVALAPRYVVETAGNLNANIRSCPRTNCDIVAKFAPGTEVDVIGQVDGESVYGTNTWLEIDFKGESAFIHGELVAEAG